MSCTVDGCDRPLRCKGFCDMHYRRWRSHGDPAIVLPPANGPSTLDKLEALSDRSGGPASCWLWLGPTTRDGYGLVTPKGERHQRLAHRVAFELEHGPVPAHLEVMHDVCDTPPCVNPSHLAAGTHRQNMEHMVGVGRSSRGLAHPRLKLTDAEVDELRQRRASGVLNRELADAFGISVSYASRLTAGVRRT